MREGRERESVELQDSEKSIRGIPASLSHLHSSTRHSVEQRLRMGHTMRNLAEMGLLKNRSAFICRPTPEEALKWGDSLDKLLVHKCKLLFFPPPFSLYLFIYLFFYTFFSSPSLLSLPCMHGL